jgi:cytochrome b
MSAQDSQVAHPARGRVWDAPVRVGHWLLVACIAIAWATRDARLADLHAASGYCALAIVSWRIVWGVAGTRFARFSHFRYSMRQALEYLRAAIAGNPPHYTGHNPAGSWAVRALLLLVALVCVSGVAAIAGMHGMGPLRAIAMAPEAAELALRCHDILAWLLLALIAAHVLGAIWSSIVHRENLVAAMVTGRKRLHEVAQQVAARRGVAVVFAGALAGFAAAYLHGSGWTDGYREVRTAAAASRPDTIWNRECGSCHLAYPATLLPARSWQRMLAEQSRHFGEDLSLGASTLRELQAHAASETATSWAAWKLSTSAHSGESPQRISKLPFWRHAHRRLAAEDFRAPVSAGPHDCEACHADAASGIFRPRMIQRPTHGITF